MLDFISSTEISDVYRKADQLNLLDESDTATIYYSLDKLNERLIHLQSVFPEDVLHAIAIKTNPEKEVLKRVIESGFGLEAASVEELQLAIDCGLPVHRAVFDSPAKTRNEIKWCEQYCPGMIVNANCLEELDRYSKDTPLRLGLRINPEMKIDAPELYNVSDTQSKFGVPISRRSEILKRSLEAPFIKGLHVHAGSDVGDFAANIQGICSVKALADEINQFRKENGINHKVEFIDIGGGITAQIDENGTNFGLAPFAEELHHACSGLCENYEVITEFGRFIHSDNGFVVSDVEYILPAIDSNPKTAILHVGADMFPRQVYSNVKTAYPLYVMNPKGLLKTGGESVNYNIGGPLCFAGDFLFRNREMQVLDEGDKLAIANSGANTTALWSRHCSREIPKCIVYSLKMEVCLIARPRTSVVRL